MMGARVIAVGALCAAVLTVVGIARGSSGHEVFVTTPRATGLLKGQLVRAGGSSVGEVIGLTPVQHGHAARVRLRIDDQAWPLRKGSTFLVRWSGTINQYNRYVDLKAGPAHAPVSCATVGRCRPRRGARP